jgi:8-oxo-dGTP diphosphatase
VSEQSPDTARPAIAAAVIVHEGKVLLVKRRVKEGSLSWQFPAGEVEPGEAAGAAAVRETSEETGLKVAESKLLGERVHPNTGRTMIYVACDVVGGAATVVDDDELVEVAWSDGKQLTDYVPYPFYGPVQEHLDATLSV